MNHYLTFKDDKSDKFWQIETSGTSFTVTYGKTGTGGTAQTKTFDTEEKCQKEAQKLLNEKLKKGYVDSGATGTQAKAPAPKVVSKKVASKETPSTDTQEKKLKERTEKTLGIPEAELASLREMPPVPFIGKQEPQPFDLNDRIEKLDSIKCGRNWWAIDWTSQNIPSFMSRQEAHFWFLVLTTAEVLEDNYEEKKNKSKIEKLKAKLRAQQIDGQLPLETAMNLMVRDAKTWEEKRVTPCSHIVVCLYHLFGLDTVINFVATYDHPEEMKRDDYSNGSYFEGFGLRLLPILNEQEREHCKSLLMPHLLPAEIGSGVRIGPYFAALDLRMKEALFPVISSWKSREPALNYVFPEYRKTSIFLLADSEKTKHYMRHIGHLLYSAEEVKRWLAITNFSDLEWVSLSIAKTFGHWRSDPYKEMLEVFCNVRAAEAARPMLQIYAISKLATIAKNWFLENPYFAIEGLLPAVIDDEKKTAELAIDIIQSLYARGYGDVIQEEAAKLSSAVQEKIKNEITENVTLQAAPFDDKTTPEWLATAVNAIGKAKPITWVVPEELPSIVIQKRKLTTQQVAAVLSELKAKGLEEDSALLKGLKQHAEPISLDEFVWKLFDLWIALGASSKDKWAMMAMGHLGSDRIALKLTPLIKVWPGESQHQRAVAGLEILKAIGTDTALMQLNSIAQKVKFKGLKETANNFMESIARKKGLKKSELEDRVVPDCGLDEQGKRVFDFGPRKFHFVLGADMKPMVKDDDGKVKDDLPKPNAKDDADKAKEAVEEWKLMKKQIREIGKIHATRMEQAMVTGRRWKTSEWELLIAKHPLMTHLAKGILWWAFFEDKKSIEVFRVTEERDYANIKDEAVKISSAAYVGIVHPLLLSDEEKKTWGQLFSDYEIISPFVQLGRPVYVLSEEDKTSTNIPGFVGNTIESSKLVFGLEKLGWSRGTAGDGGGFDEHSKQFPIDDVTAVIRYDGDDLSFGNIGGQNLEIEGAYFARGMREPSGYEDTEEGIPLTEINPIAFSETLHALLEVSGFTYSTASAKALQKASLIVKESLSTPEKKQEVFEAVDYTEVYNQLSSPWKKFLSNHHSITKTKNHKAIGMVKELNLSFPAYKITTIKEVLLFPKLEELEISIQVPDKEHIAGIKNLKKLQVSDWHINDLKFLSKCTQLEEITLKNIVGLDDEIDCSWLNRLKARISLDLADRKLTRFPLAIVSIERITELDLSRNTISELPENIGVLKELTSISFRYNELNALPKSFSLLQNLVHLDLSANKFIDFPEEILQLKNLKGLTIWENQLSSLPKEIGSMENLEDLSISENKFSVFPEAVLQLRNLKNLSLSENQLTVIPDEIEVLQKLEVLRLSKNPISALPKGFAKLSALKMLVLDGTDLEDLPDFIADMTSIETVYFESKEYNTLRKWCKGEYKKFEKLLDSKKFPKAAEFAKELFAAKKDDFVKLNKHEVKLRISEGYERSAEVFAADVIALGAILKDSEIFSMGVQMTTDKYINARIPFNTACYYALTQQKEPMLAAIRKAKSLGKEKSSFSDKDFNFYKSDTDFIAAVNS